MRSLPRWRKLLGRNNKKKRGKCSKKTESIEGIMEMNIRMVRESEERQQKFLENLFKQQKEADKLERETDQEFLLKLGQTFKNGN